MQPAPALPTRRIMPIVLVCISLVGVILALVVVPFEIVQWQYDMAEAMSNMRQHLLDAQDEASVYIPEMPTFTVPSVWAIIWDSLEYILPFIVAGIVQLFACRISILAFSRQTGAALLRLSKPRFRDTMRVWALLSIVVNVVAMIPAGLLILLIFMNENKPIADLILLLPTALVWLCIISSFALAIMLLVRAYRFRHFTA